MIAPMIVAGIAADALVMRGSGSVTAARSVRAGDALMGANGGVRNVLSVATGVGPMRRIVPIKGDSFDCSSASSVTLAGTGKFLGMTIDAPLDKYISKYDRMSQAGRLDTYWKLTRSGVSFPRREVPFEPYFLGVWIGDGTLGEAHITNRDPEIRAYCREFSVRNGLLLWEREEPDKNSWTLMFRSGEGRHGGENTLRRFLRRECEVDGSKCIPDAYLRNSAEVRAGILAGILDADGFLVHGTMEVATVSDTLCAQYLFLARSLGLAAYSAVKIATIKSLGFSGAYHRITISGDVASLPCLVARRKCDDRQQIKRVSVTGFDVHTIADGEWVGFVLDGDGRFLLGDFTVVHDASPTELRIPVGLPRPGRRR